MEGLDWARGWENVPVRGRAQKEVRRQQTEGEASREERKAGGGPRLPGRGGGQRSTGLLCWECQSPGSSRPASKWHSRAMPSLPLFSCWAQRDINCRRAKVKRLPCPGRRKRPLGPKGYRPPISALWPALEQDLRLLLPEIPLASHLPGTGSTLAPSEAVVRQIPQEQDPWLAGGPVQSTALLWAESWLVDGVGGSLPWPSWDQCPLVSGCV